MKIHTKNVLYVKVENGEAITDVSLPRRFESSEADGVVTVRCHNSQKIVMSVDEARRLARSLSLTTGVPSAEETQWLRDENARRYKARAGAWRTINEGIEEEK